MSLLLDADYSAIEARITCWVAGQEDALDEYRQGVDRYKRMASFIFNVPEDKVNKHPQRFIGKQAILLCGFQGGPPKFRATCEKFGYKDMPAGLEVTAVETFREKHPCIKSYWPDVENAAKRAIVRKGEVFNAAPKGGAYTRPEIKFQCRDIEGMSFLLIRLPSGRKLAYPKPKIVPSRKFEGRTEIQFFGNIVGTQWGNVSTYGGSLVENIVQGIAADIMVNGVHKAEAAGYETATLIHDQALSYYKEGQTVEEFVRCLTDLPPRARGLPIAAEGALVPFYRKD